jgi:hypothetical protein
MEELITGKGHYIIYFPKYHSELNYIEMVWAYMKQDTGSNCTFDYHDLCTRVAHLLESGIPLSHVRKMEERCFMHGYQLKMAGPMLDYYAMTQYLFISQNVSKQYLPNGNSTYCVLLGNSIYLVYLFGIGWKIVFSKKVVY